MESLNIKVSNVEKLAQMLTETQKGITSQRNLTSEDVVAAVSKADEKLTALGIPKKLHKGAVLVVSPYFRLPSSYKYPASYSRVVLDRRSTGWFVRTAGRTGGNSSPGPELILGNEQQAATPHIFNL